MNFTIQVPEGTMNHGDPRIMCTPPTWRDYITFFALNYFIHAATLPSVPGETKREMTFAVLNALFVPGFGVSRAMRRLVLRPALRRKRHFDCALAAGALCMVVSDDTKYRPRSDNWANRTFSDDLLVLECPHTRRVHGRCKLPPDGGYILCVVPPGAKLEALNPAAAPKDWVFEPGYEYNFVKILFSLVQAVAGGITVYRARGDQIQQYGYGAFGLSVVPYIFMSVINIIASFLCPEFPAMYLVHSPDMDDASSKGGQFDGLVARLVVSEPGLSDDEKLEPEWVYQKGVNWLLVKGIFWLLLIFTPLIIVGGLSGFRTGEISTVAQRGWLMSWLVVGSLSSLWIVLVLSVGVRTPNAIHNHRWQVLGFGMSVLLLWAPAVGGMVTVGLELRDYGVCIRLD
ncbi:hypothetical protein MFIFM68171_04671 [Madurella fahalii]|uniref:Uncharacterized protein n=1 Tax=Madurella fahalii TaxID=1157608 RepID=A0ABQ0G9L1_9PEZI